MRFTTLDFIIAQWSPQHPVVKADLAGKTVVVIGANTGLGFEASKHFAQMNPGRLILGCRSERKGKDAVEKIKNETGISAELWLIDLADFASVSAFADRFEREGGRLDILVENAGVATDKYEVSKDGWETSMQVNDLSTPLLALRLLPLMVKTAKEHQTTPRLVIVASEVHHWTEISKEVAEDPSPLSVLGSAEFCSDPKQMTDRYYLTKLLNVFFVRAFNDRLPPSTPVVIDAVNPGFCRSELNREAVGLAGILFAIMQLLLAHTTEEGSRQLIYAALAEGTGEKLRGQFVTNYGVSEVSDFVLTPMGVKLQDRLWDDLIDILQKVDPKVGDVVNSYLSSYSST
ncbi:unnamed protein product [Mycena citricolor]|uniref:NAD(P)-binding protein n=1 Tax=Mycena citricolor TaxID=2018698 RepID=A0AAD2HZ86_9AGAR|nr:unnamed protein product [Mycena citricolor]CAK5283323.1 unnamed protein product [Mycena citricolor]